MKTTVFQFEEVFEIAADGMPVVKRPLLIKEMLLTPGAICLSGFKFRGTDISGYSGLPIVAYDHGSHLELLGFSKFSRDHDNEKWVIGWAVVRNAPWTLFGFFPTKEQAEEALKDAGKGFEVRHGSKRIGSNDDFMS